MNRNRLLRLTLMVLWCAGAASALQAAPLPQAVRKIDARLMSRTLGSPQEVVSAWVHFTDKGEAGSADMARRLAAAERALSPRNRQRRIKAGVAPLVDALDLPVSGEYLEQLRADGFKPFAVSRWFNRAAVRVPAGELPRIARFGFVSSLAPVETAWRMRDPETVADPRPAPGLNSELGESPVATNAINYGVSFKQLQLSNLPALHNLGFVGQGVVICMLDNGFYRQDVHRATRVINVPPGFRRDFVDGDTVMTTDPNSGGHGENTLSLAGANLPGHLVGAAPGAMFALARTEVDATETVQEMFNWGLGAEWADSLGADVISSSLGYFTFDGGIGDYVYANLNGHTTVVTRAAEIAAAKGILVVDAAGNSGPGGQTLIAPADANGDSVITVGAVDSNGVVASYSSHGPTADGRIKPDLMTRGSLDWLPFSGTDSTYTRGSGTSYATPILAGICACIMSGHPGWTATTVVRALRETASRFATPDNTYGYGIANALSAFNWTHPLLSAGPAPGAPFGIRLLGPNPLRPGGALARVGFTLGADAPAGSVATVRVVDVSGRAVCTLWSGVLARSGTVEAAWNGRDEAGQHVLPGVYWVALHSGARTAAVRLVAL